ncbi:MAG: hypothetical protein K2Z80_19805 [Xanthobacteraceae bacterium]|nr:hypothetical protein [Xanthobacteraceae bacterium]
MSALVGCSITSRAGEQGWRDGNVERLGGLEIDDQLELRGLNDPAGRQVSRFENSACIGSSLAMVFRKVDAAADETVKRGSRVRLCPTRSGVPPREYSAA